MDREHFSASWGIITNIAKVSGCVQVGQESYRDMHVSREFHEERSIAGILSWAKIELGREDFSICDVQFSEYCEWNNLGSWGSTLIETLDSLRACKE